MLAFFDYHAFARACFAPEEGTDEKPYISFVGIIYWQFIGFVYIISLVLYITIIVKLNKLPTATYMVSCDIINMKVFQNKKIHPSSQDTNPTSRHRRPAAVAMAQLLFQIVGVLASPVVISPRISTSNKLTNMYQVGFSCFSLVIQEIVLIL